MELFDTPDWQQTSVISQEGGEGVDGALGEVGV